MNPSLSEMVTDGANRVGTRHPATPEAAVCFASAVLLTVAMLRAPRSRGLAIVAIVAVLASAVPGLMTIAQRRADSPDRAMLAAAAIDRFQEQVESFAGAKGCAAVVKSACTACDPIVDFALATSPTCSAPAPIILGPDALTAGCTDAHGALTCGAGAGP